MDHLFFDDWNHYETDQLDEDEDMSDEDKPGGVREAWEGIFMDEEQQAIKDLEMSLPEDDRDGLIVSDKYNHDDSDIDIISSDGIHFLVHTFVLRQACLFHKSTIPSQPPQGGHQPIIMTDHDIGHSTVLANFLDLIYPVVWVNLDDGILNRRVIRLARHWECLYVLDRMAREILLRTMSDTTSKPRTSLFITAVGLEDPTLLGTIVAKTGSRRWPSTWNNMEYICGGMTEIEKKRRNPLTPLHYDFGCWSLEEYLLIPPTVIWTLLDQMRHADSSSASGSMKDWNYASGWFGSSLHTAYRTGYEPPYGTSNIYDEARIEALHRNGRSYKEDQKRFTFQEKWTANDTAECGIEVDDDPVSRYNGGDSDLVLISSDGLHFEVHGTILGKASPVIASMLSLKTLSSPNEPLQLLDELLEHSTIIEALLGVIYEFELPPLYRVTTILYLIDLADKWEIGLVNKVVVKNLESAFYTSTARNFDLFLIAIKLAEHGIAARLIQREETGGRYDNRETNFPPLQIFDKMSWQAHWASNGVPMMLHDPTTWQYWDFIQLPPAVAWALQRAALMWDHGLVDDVYLLDCEPERIEARKKSIAEDFRRIMDPKYRPQKPPPAGSRGFALGNGKN